MTTHLVNQLLRDKNVSSRRGQIWLTSGFLPAMFYKLFLKNFPKKREVLSLTRKLWEMGISLFYLLCLFGSYLCQIVFQYSWLQWLGWEVSSGLRDLKGHIVSKHMVTGMTHSPPPTSGCCHCCVPPQTDSQYVPTHHIPVDPFDCKPRGLCNTVNYRTFGRRGHLSFPLLVKSQSSSDPDFCEWRKESKYSWEILYVVEPLFR